MGDTYVLLGVFIAIAAIDWVFVALGKDLLESLFKPTVLIVLLLWFVQKAPVQQHVLALVFFVALCASLVGDVYMINREINFLKAVIAFSITQAAYVLFFNFDNVVLSVASFFVFVAVGIVAILVFWQLKKGMIEKGQRDMIVPLLAYTVLISLMLWSALTLVLRPEWPLRAAVIGALGGLLFFVSDLLIAWGRYIRDFRQRRTLVMISYHLAQFCLTFAAVSLFE